MKLADVIGKRAASEIEATHRLSFHAVGDTGKGARGSCRYVACQILGVKGKSPVRA